MSFLQRIAQSLGRLLRRVFGPERPEPPNGPRPEPPAQPIEKTPAPVAPTPPERQWTLMIYMAGDNGMKFETETGWTQILYEMTSAGYKDITELRTAGSSPQVQALVQFDTVSETDRSYRITVNAKGQAPTIETIPEINTGDPNSLRDFIVWGQTNFPARHYAVIVWNHGGGWKEEDIYEDVRTRGARYLRPALFKSTYGAVRREQAAEDGLELKRWIAADDTSKDFLDNNELQLAFQQAAETTGQPVHVIGMDACLMAMIEVAYQLRDQAQVLVASEEIEPMPGWQYTSLLERLHQQPALTPQQFGEAAVQLYMESYANGSDEITQSAIVLDRLEPLAHKLAGFVDAVAANLDDEGVYRALAQAQLYTVAFEDSDYRDLLDFMLRVRDGLTAAQEAGLAGEGAAQVLAAVEGVQATFANPAETPVLANGVRGERFQSADGRLRVNGLSIYLPKADAQISPAYDTLDFAKSRWGELVTLLQNK